MLKNDKIQMLIESKDFAPLTDYNQSVMRIVLENTARDFQNSVRLNEGTVSGDVAQFTPILMPLVRRSLPNLIANELLGVQPMTMPTGFLYALVNTYSGDNASKKIDPNSKGVILQLEDAETSVNEGETFNTDWKCIYKEGPYMLCLDPSGSHPIQIGSGTPVGGKNVVAQFTNEAAFSHILKNYTGPYKTSAGEKLSNDMKEVGFTVTKKSIEAQTRALKGQWTVEMYQDLQAQHGLYADNEMINLMSYEVNAEIDREVVDFVNANSTQCPDTKFTATNAEVPYGRWEMERYRAEAIRMAKEAALVGIECKRGNANILLCSPKVATMLEQVGNFKLAPVASTVGQPIGGVAGVFDNKYKVIVDQYATSDYCTALYRGAGVNDAMGFFCPYVPVSFTKIMDQTSGQPGVICKTRYALTTTPGILNAQSNDRAKTYSRSWGIDFNKTILA